MLFNFHSYIQCCLLVIRQDPVHMNFKAAQNSCSLISLSFLFLSGS